MSMKTQNVLGMFGIVSVAAVSIGLAPQSGAPAPKTAAAGAETFSVDSVHSSLIFKIQHMGIANFYGRFNEIAGTYSVDQANPANSRFDFKVPTASVDTKDAKRDGHLKSPDFFNATEYPEITFKSTKVVRGGDNQLKVTGDLGLHGVTKPVTVNMTLFPAKQTRQGYKGGFETTFDIKRTDFGMDTYVA